MRFFRSAITLACAVLLTVPPTGAQTAAEANASRSGFISRVTSPYRPHMVSPVNLSNSDRLEKLLHGMADEVTARGRCGVAVERIRTGAPAMMDARIQNAIEAASVTFAGGKSVRMPSGAGHDAQVLATIMPAGMLFVPSIGGISHHWSENTADADIVTGAEVFVEACRRLLAG